MPYLTITLALIMLLLAAALGGFYAVWLHLPTIRAEIILPAPNVSRQIAEPAPKIEPIPQDVLDYVDQESEEHARVGRRHRVRALYTELGTWPAAFAALQREDNLG